jgi:hypothetical protein
MTPAIGHFTLTQWFASPGRCPHCGDWMIAPVSSEFVVGGEIRHHWDCDGCGESSSTIVDLFDRQHAPENCAA